MRTPPESYLIFKSELEKAKLEKEQLRLEYESKLANINKELARLKEQISAQQELMKTTINYAIKLEDDLGSFKQEVESQKKKRKSSFH
jgi:membrane-anchored protein YejM (alkaline phosphatase superfamily)